MKSQLYKFLSWGVGKVLYTFALTLIFLLPTISARADEREPGNIAVTTLPQKTLYLIGEELDLWGGEVTVTFSDNTFDTSPLSNVQVTGFDNTSAGDKTITVSWYGKETSFTVTVKEDDRTITNLYSVVLECPVGTSWNEITIGRTFEDGNFDNIPLTFFGVEVSGLNTDIIGIQHVTATYKGLSVEWDIEIYKPVSTLDFSNITTSVNLNVKEKPYGEVILNYTDGTTGKVDISKMQIWRYVEAENMLYCDCFISAFNEGIYQTLGEHELDIHYHDASATLKIEYYDGPIPYAVFNNGTLSFFYDKNKPSDAFGFDFNYEDWGRPWKSIAGNITKVEFNSSFAAYHPTDLCGLFEGMYQLTDISGIDNLKTSLVTEMDYMFMSCNSLSSIDLSGFSTDNVTTMRCMFDECSSLTSLDLSSFNTSKVTDMKCMFDCQGVSRLNTIYVGDGWTTSAVTLSNDMFAGCGKLYGSKGSSPKALGVTDATYARFDGGESAPGYFTRVGETPWIPVPVSLKITSSPTQTEYVLGEPFNYEGLVVTFTFSDNSKVVVEPNSYYNQGTIEDDLKQGLKFSDFDYTTTGKKTITLTYNDLSDEFDVTVVDKGDCGYQFLDEYGTLTFYYGQYSKGASYLGPRGSLLSQNVAHLVKKVVFNNSFENFRPTSCRNWFMDMSSLSEIVGMKDYLNTTLVTDMSSMFSQCELLTSIDLSGFNTQNVTNLNSMFSNCFSLASIDLSGFNTQSVTEMGAMFWGCKSLNSIDLSSFNTANVTTMQCMFAYCSGLTSLDLSSFDTKNVTIMSMMFYEDINLQTIIAGPKWTTINISNAWSMFYNCTSLVGGKGTTYDANFTDLTFARIDDPENGKPGYFTYKASAQEDNREAYALLTDNGETVTFYYNEDKSQHEDALGFDGDYWNFGWKSAKVAIFDESFKEYKPTSCAFWFYDCTQLTEIRHLDYLNTEDVTEMQWMFMGCKNLESIDVSKFNTSKVTSMAMMFQDCAKITELDLSSFDNSQVKGDGCNFFGCKNLTTIYGGDKWITPNLFRLFW